MIGTQNSNAIILKKNKMPRCGTKIKKRGPKVNSRRQKPIRKYKTRFVGDIRIQVSLRNFPFSPFLIKA
jgi:hypothetical protein